MDTEATAALAAIEAWQSNDKFGRDTSARVHTCKQEAVIAYGEAILKGREKYPGNVPFNDWITENKLDQAPFKDFRERAAAMTVARVIGSRPDDAPFAACPFNTPSDMVRWGRESGMKWEAPAAKPAAKPAATPFNGDNLDAVVSEFGRQIGYDPNDKSWDRRKREIETLFERGTEHLRAMVGLRGRGKVGLESAARYATNKTAAEQDAATEADVRGYRQVARGTGRKEGPDKPKKPSLDDWRRNQNQMAIDAALRRAGKPPITPEEFERPPPELRHQQYPGREPGVTYGNVHREEHGHTWHNVSKRKREMLERKLKDLAAEVEKAFEGFDTLEPNQNYSVRKRWRIALDRILAKHGVDLNERVTAEEAAEFEAGEAAGEAA